jgi:hypothetical protein
VTTPAQIGVASPLMSAVRTKLSNPRGSAVFTVIVSFNRSPLMPVVRSKANESVLSPRCCFAPTVNGAVGAVLHSSTSIVFDGPAGMTTPGPYVPPTVTVSGITGAAPMNG